LNYRSKLDNEKDIQIAAEKLAKDNGWSKIRALTALHSKYQSEGRLEEAVTVSKLIEIEKTKDEDNAKAESGYHNDA
jgi:hypothetical protein